MRQSFLKWAAAAGLAAAIGCGGGDSGTGPNPPPAPPPPPPPAPVASVVVSPPSATILVGATASFGATVRDAAGNQLSGRTVTWASSNPSVATVSGSGTVTGVAPGGPVSITATSEGKSGSAHVTVLAPVASVVVTGVFRTKVGDTYQYTATAKLADGTVVTRPMTWSVAEPTRATMTAGGQMTPLQTGSITIQVTIDGAVWEVPATAYDWLPFGSGTTFGIGLPADAQITNHIGISEYPDLVMGCSGGLFLLFVDTDNFVTASGLVAYAFDAQPVETAVWLEFDSFSALAHPGPDLATRAFAARMAAARQFGFAFTEFSGPAQATLFRVTGLSAQLPAFASCPSAAPMAVAGDSSSAGRTDRMQAMIARPTPMTAERALRAELHATAAARTPDLHRVIPPASQAARRRTAIAPQGSV